MARPLRIEYPGAVYHITSRGNWRENIFLNDEDRNGFIQTFSDAIERYNWLCHAFCLMDNHYHLLVETPDSNLSLGMRHINGVYTQLFNRKHRRVGLVFQGRYKSIVVEKNTHLLELCRYVVLNPVRASMVKKPGDWKWSSYNAMAYAKEEFDFLTIDWALGQFSSKKKVAMEQYQKFVNAGIDNTISPWSTLKGQIFLGNDDFIGALNVSKSKGEHIREVPRIQRYANRIALERIFLNHDKKDKPDRNKKVRQAYFGNGYKMKEIANHLSVHYTTISKIINNNKK